MTHISLDEWQSLEPILDAALELEPVQRVEFVRASCSDPALRERLEQLLQAAEDSESLFQGRLGVFTPLLQMPDVLGDRYRIIRELGSGGMATVYLADDTKHRRQVAVKVLDSALAHMVGDATFQQEIEIVARLQHAHILPLFDSGDVEGLPYYVMPYVEGESLRQRLARERQLPIEDAIRIAREVADALDFAHRHGVVHRDIKPENILLREGRALVTDFGIALAQSAVVTRGDSDVILGTPHYMSPEQVSSRDAVGQRSDIYSLGVVLYEMLAGATPHSAETPGELLASVATEPVGPVMARRKSVPPNVAAVVAKATELLPADRFGHAHELARALDDPSFRHGADDGTPRRRRHRAYLAAGIVAILALGAALVATLRPAPSPAFARFDITPRGTAAMLPSVPLHEFALSRDGAHLVYVAAARSGGTQLWMRTFDDLEPRPIPGSLGAVGPALSPDGRSVAFHDGRGIKTLPLRGGSASTVVTDGTMPTWGSDGTLFYSHGRRIYAVAPSGGAPRPVTTEMGWFPWFPSALPNGRGLLLTARGRDVASSRIAVVGPDGGTPREIVTGAAARYASGHLMWVTAGGTLMAAPFDVQQLRLTGPGVVLLEGVRVKIGSESLFALSETGRLVIQLEAAEQHELVWVSRSGGVEPMDRTWTGNFSSPALSPDGTRLAVVLRDRSARSAHIWVKRLDDGARSRLTSTHGVNVAPAWTPDGRSLTFSVDSAADNQSWTLWTQRADGSAAGVSHGVPGSDARWSPDGTWLVYRRGFIGADVLGLRPDQDSLPTAVLASEHGERNAVISPDGRWIAYTSNETGRDEVYVKPFPDTDAAKWVVSTTGGIEPLWSRSGKELFYRNDQRQMVAVRVATDPTFALGPASILFTETAFLRSLFRPQYDVTPDDQRFIMVRHAEGDAVGRLILLENWQAELKRLAPR